MDSEKKRLLFIEDDIIDQKAFKRFAGRVEFPYYFDIAGSVREAKQLLESNRYDVVLADYSLGDGTAFDILKVVENIPTVIVTGTGDEEVAVKAMKLGIYDYLIKDVEGHYLKMVSVTVENAIKHFYAEQKLQQYHEDLEKLVAERTVELRKSEQKYRTLIDGTFDMVMSIDLKGIVTSWNRQAQEVFGYEPNEIIGKNGSVLVPEELGNEREELIARVKEVDFVKAFETTRVTKDGTRIPVEITISTMKDKAGNIIGISGILRDITERKQAEEALCIERDNLKNIFEAIKDGVYIVNQQYDIQYVNPVLVKDFGAYEGRKCYEYFHDRTEKCPWCKSSDIFAGKSVHWEWHSFKNQRTYDLLDTPLKNPDGSISKLEIFRDITERKQAEKTLKENERRLKESQQIARIGQWELDIVNNHLYWSAGIYNLFEIDPDKFEASYEAFINAIHPDDREFVNNAYTESLKTKAPYDIIHRLLLKNGTIKYVNEICRTEYDINGKPLRSIGTVQDITELKQAETELKKHHDHLEELVEERTKELVEKNNELERFNKLFVDRELRIKELKNRIKEYEKK